MTSVQYLPASLLRLNRPQHWPSADNAGDCALKVSDAHTVGARYEMHVGGEATTIERPTLAG
jgi:hypothetical protein